MGRQVPNIRKPKGRRSYYLRVTVGGREVWRSLRTSNHEEAKRRAPAERERLMGGGVASDPTFAEFVEQVWLKAIQTSRNEKNCSLAGQRMRDWVLPSIGDKRVRALRPSDLRGLRADLDHSPLRPQTVVHVLSEVRHALRLAREEEFADRLPWPAGLMPKLQEQDPKSLTNEEVAKVLGVSMDRRWFGYLVVGLNTGLRWGELLRLRIGDVSAGELRVRHATKSSRNRTVPLPKTAEDAIRKEIGDRTNPKDFVFTYRPKNAASFTRQISKRVGFHFHIHMLRHTYATRLVNLGVTAAVVRELMGHSTIRVTERYFIVRKASMEDAVRRLDALGE